MTKGIIVSPANRGVQVVVTDENNVQLLIDSNRGVNLSVVPQPRIEVLVDKGVEGAQGPVGPQGPQGTAATVTAGTTTTGLAGTNAIVTNSGTSSAAVFDFTIPRGDTGATGATGAGVAVGGTTGQVLVKASGVNYDTTWATITGTLVYQGSWNAATNTPTLTSSVGTNGYYYVVGTSGSTNLNGITDWVVGDWAIFNGTIWQKIDNTDLVSSVNGQTGVVVLTASSVGALAIANNLSDLANAGTARTNLGLGTAATQNSTAFATAAQGATADTALQTVTSADGSIVVLQTGTNIDLAVSAASPASTLLTQVRNTTGATLTKGTVVYISGATGQISTVSKANASSDATSAQTLGMITANLANNSNGYVTVFGLLQNMDTSAYTDGAQLYLSGTVAGAVTATKPSAPTHLVYVAIVEYAHPTQGKLLVKVQNGYELAEIHDVSIVSPTTGQTLVYSSVTDLWSNSNAPTITGGTINNTTVGATTPSTGVFTTLTANTSVTTPIVGAATGSSTTGLDLNVNNKTQARIVEIGDGTRPLVINGGSAGGAQSPGISAPVNLHLSSGTSARVIFYTNGRSTTQQAEISHTASAVNYHQLTGGATTKGVIQSAQGSDTNIAQVFQSKGTGAIDLAAGSSGVNISNGGTVTAITRTATGSSYTSFPSISITAPTTAGGVQATASTATMFATGATVVAGGTGYTLNDVVTLSGGTPQTVGATYTVTSVSAGVVTAVTPLNYAIYTALPTNPVSVTGGTGSGLTLTVLWNWNSATITNAGSGYVEQPTVTFSGGGGSGAAAYATVGSATTVRSLGSTVQFATPAGIQAQISDSGSATPTAYPNLNGSTFNLAYVTAVGSAGNAGLVLASKGTSAVDIYTNSTGSRAASFSHTASAVNYVQVTGASTGGRPVISAQGSDTSIALDLQAKGTSGYVNIDSFRANYLRVQGSSTNGGIATLSTQGVDTNIDLALTPKGTGSVVSSINGGTFTTARDSANNRVQLRSNGNLGLFAQSGGAVGFYTNTAGDVLQMQIAHTASAVNYVQVTGAATGGRVAISAQGSDTNIPLVLQPKGTGALQAQQTDSTATGGNARGANAVDWQTIRTSAASVSSGFYSVIGGGNNNKSNGFAGFIGGGFGNSQNGGNYGLIAGGALNTLGSTTEYATIVGGYANTANGYLNFIGGGYTNSGTSGSAVTTQSGTMNATTAVTLSGSNANIKVGQLITGTSINSFPHTYVVAISGTSLTLSQAASGSSTSTLSFFTPHGVVVGGGNNQATGSYSFIGGGGDAGTAANRNVASGDWATVGGGRKNVASGFGSFIGGGFGNSCSAQQYTTVLGGENNNAFGNTATVGGGYGQVASGEYSFVSGGVVGTTRSISGFHAFPACAFPIALVTGVSQAGLLVLGRQTTDATPTVLASNSNAASTTNQVILPNNSAYYFRGEVVSGVTGGGNTKGWFIEGVIKRGANAASTALVGTPTVTSNYADAGASTWTIAVTADTTNGGLAVTFTGQAATTIRTVAQIRTTEMTY